MLSIIIPTLNEEDYLPHLLSSIKKQDFKDYEIILADANSKDKTKEIAESHGCRIIKGGLPAVGRNNGAKAAKGDLLFFIDADVVLSDGFLKKTLKEFKDRKLDLAGFQLHPYPVEKVTYFLVNNFYNRVIAALEEKFPHLTAGIIIKKSVFESLSGFDETIKFAEDYDLARRSVEQYRFGIIRAEELWLSDRRWRKEGWAKVWLKHVVGDLHTMFIGPVRSDILNYQWGHYKKLDKEKNDD